MLWGRDAVGKNGGVGKRSADLFGPWPRAEDVRGAADRPLCKRGSAGWESFVAD